MLFGDHLNCYNHKHVDLAEMRAIRASLESMEKMLKDVYEVTEEKAVSFARQTSGQKP